MPRKRYHEVVVCDACLTEACWQGVLMCEEAKIAGTTVIRIEGGQ